MFKYSLKKTLSNKMFIFWSFVFPVTLMYFFHIAFGGLYEMENRIDVRDTAVIYEAENEFSTYFGDVIDQLSEGEDAILKIVEEDEDTLYEMVRNNEICGVFIVKADTIDVAMSPKYNDTDAMILKTIANFYIREFDMVSDAAARGDHQ